MNQITKNLDIQVGTGPLGYAIVPLAQPIAAEATAMSIVIDTQKANDIKHRLHQQNLTVKQWAANHGYQYHTVSNVLRGVNKATFGAGREVAEKLIRL